MPVRRRVLIADDDACFREVLQQYLQKAGFSVCSAHNARAAFAIGRELSLDYIILDLGLPHLDLEWFMRLVRQGAITPDAHVLLVTGAGAGPLETWSRRLGVSLHLVKSTFSLERLIELIEGLEGTLPPAIASSEGVEQDETACA